MPLRNHFTVSNTNSVMNINCDGCHHPRSRSCVLLWLACCCRGARACSRGRIISNTRFVLVNALHCFCRSDGTEKNTIVSSSTPASAIIYDACTSIIKTTTTYEVRRSSFFFCTTIMYS